MTPRRLPPGIRRAPRTGRYEARYRDTAGRQRTQTFDLLADARAFLDATRTDLVRGVYIDPALGRTRFEDYASEWLGSKAGVSARTLVNIEGRLRNHVLPAFGSVALGGIEPADVRAFVAKLTAAGLSPSTVKASYLVVAQVLRMAVVDGLIPRSPCIEVALPSDRQHDEMRFLTKAQVDALGDAIEDRYRALIYTAVYGGLRAGELGALKVDRVQLPAGVLEVVESLAEVHGHLEAGPTKTGRRRTITVPRFLATMLGEHLGRYPSRERFVFSAAKGGPIRHRNFYQRHFRPAVRRAGLDEGLRFHDLRHTCAALLIAAGRHLEEVKAHLGHSSIRVTSDRYGHLFPDARQAVADALDETYRGAGVRQAQSGEVVAFSRT